MNQKTNNNISAALGRVLGAACFLSLVQPASAAQWEFGVSADLSVIYTDNLRLEAEGEEDSDTVFLISPTFSLSTEGEDGLQADIRYRPEAYFYSEESDADEVFDIVDAQATVPFVRDALFLYVSAVNFQSITSPDVAFPTSNLPITGTRIDSTVYEVRPYWEQDLGEVNVLAEVSYVASEFDDASVVFSDFNRDNTVRTGIFSMNNYGDQSGLTWGFDYTYFRVEYDQADPWDYQQAKVDLGFWLNGTTRLFAAGGLESSYENFFDPSLEDELWEFGFQYAPNSRLNFEVAAGERSFGSSIRGNVSYRLRRGTTTLSYSEAPTSRADIAGERRPVVSADNLDAILDRPGSADRFVQRRGEWQTDIELAKSEFSLRIFFEARDQRTTDTGQALGDERLFGLAGRWTWRLGAKSTLGVAGDFARRKENLSVGVGDAESDLSRASIDYTYSLSPRLSLIAMIQRSEEDDVLGGSMRNYVENQYHLTLRASY